MNFFSGYFKKVTEKKMKARQGGLTGTWSGTIARNTGVDRCPFVVFDTELSGLNAKKDFIVSIGAIKMTGGTINISSEFYRMIRPAGEMTRTSVEIHGMTPGELENKEPLETVLPDFLDFIRDSVLVGHFVGIDLAFVNRALKIMGGSRLRNPAVDTHRIHEWLSENSGEFKKHYHGTSAKTDLFSIAERYGITISAAHDALGDAFITAQLFQKFLHFLHAGGMGRLDELLDIGRA
ncbi:MAG: 3'-5' exonuclease [Nitrospiraceae bacterium]|nr:MAG: 3'-5' exonuclease [Nitrospiraceae bacterium]